MTASLLIAYVITSLVIPSIIKLSAEKRLFDKPDQRKSHTSEIPTLGGAAVFIGMLVPTTLFKDLGFDHELKYIMAGLIILLFIGIKDDILNVSPWKKLVAELFAITVVVVLGGIRVTSFHGFLQIWEIPYIISILFTFFMFIVIINGFNLIDGIDGLASGVGILTMTTITIWCLLTGDHSYAAFGFSVIGALVAFFRLNVFGKKNKIFLGDTGSLIVGMIVTVFTIKFLESPLPGLVVSDAFPTPAIAIGLLIVPLIDTLRVFTLRILVGKSPFSADRFHTHHKFLLHGFSHFQTTLWILGFNLLIIALSLSLYDLGNIRMLLITIPVSIIITSIPGLVFRYRVRRFLTRLNLLGRLSWILPVTFTNLIISRLKKIKYKRPDYLDDDPDGKEQQKNKDLDKIIQNAYLRFEENEHGYKAVSEG